jgi:hypothetical protein
MDKARGRLRIAAALAMAGMATVGSATAAQADTGDPAAVPAAIVAALDSGTPAQQAAIYATLTPQQQVAVSTPASTAFPVVPASAPSDLEQTVLSTGTLTGNDLGSVTAAGRTCGDPYFTGNWQMKVTALAGNTLYIWHLDTNWNGNCQTITALDYHYAYPTNMFFLETYQKKLVDEMEGQGQPSGNAVGQGQMAACINIGPFNNCWASSTPIIHEDFDAWGGRSAWGAA